MTMFLVNTFPSWALAILVVAVCMVFAIVASRVVQWSIRGTAADDRNEVVGSILQTSGGVYAVLLALVVIALWEQRTGVDDHAAEEAGFLLATYRDIGGLPPEFASDAREKIATYVHAVIEKSYPALREGHPDEATRTTYGDMFTAIRSFQPRTRHDEILYGEALRELNRSSEARTKRLSAVRGGLPPVFWAVLLASTAFTLATAGALRMENAKVRDRLMATFGASIGVLLFLLVVLDRPFSGDFATTPEPYQEALDAMKKAG